MWMHTFIVAFDLDMLPLLSVGHAYVCIHHPATKLIAQVRNARIADTLATDSCFLSCEPGTQDEAEFGTLPCSPPMS